MQGHENMLLQAYYYLFILFINYLLFLTIFEFKVVFIVIMYIFKLMFIHINTT